MPLQKTLAKTEAVTVDIENASHQMAIVATVLEEKLPAELQVGEVAQALKHADALEKKLGQSAETLAEVNAALAAEIDHRAELTEQLDEAQALVKKLDAEEREIND